MARDLVLDVITRSKSKGLTDAAAGLDRTAKSADKAGTEFRQLSEEAKGLERSLATTRKRYAELRAEFARTGDKTILGDLKKERTFLGTLEKIRKELEKVEHAGAGVSASLGGAAAGGGLAGAFKAIPNIGGVPGPLIAAGAGAAVALAPAIGGTIAAAVLGGVGTGGVIGGIALASQDSRVKAAWKEVGHDVFTELSDAASPFVVPLTKAAKQFGQDWAREANSVRSLFAALAPTIEPLQKGLAGFVHELMPGLTNAARASVPLASKFGEEMEKLGGSMGQFLTNISEAEPGAEAALHDLFGVIDDGIEATGEATKALAGIYDLMHKLPTTALALKAIPLFGFSSTWAELDRNVSAAELSLTAVRTPAQQLTRDLEEQADAASKDAAAIERNTRALEDYFDMVVGKTDARIRYQQAIDDLTESFKRNGHSLDIGTQEGRDNARALDEVARAAKDLLDIGAITDQQYQDLIKDAERRATKLGAEKSAVHDLLGELEKLPKQIITEAIVNISARVDKAFAALFGSGNHINPNAAQLFRGNEYSAVPPGSTGTGSVSHQAFYDMPTRDRGGPVMAGQSYLIGGAPEILTMGSMGGYVTPMGGGTQVTLRAGGGGAMEAMIRAMLPYLVAEVQHRGGQPGVVGIRNP